MKHPSENAREICEDFLERTRIPLLTGDDGDVMEFFLLPVEIQTFTGQRIITTDTEMGHFFRSLSTHYRKLGVTDIVRHCVEACFKSPDRLFATTETRLLRGNVMVQAPIPVFSVFKFTAGKWKVASSSYAIKDRPDHDAALMSACRCLYPRVSA